MAAKTGTGALVCPKPGLSAAGARHYSGTGGLVAAHVSLLGSIPRAIEGAGALVGPKPSIAAGMKRGYTLVVDLVGPRARISAATYVPDPTIWETDNQAWGDADFIYSEAKPVMIIGNSFWQADSGARFDTVDVQVMLTRTGLAITGKDRMGNWKVDPATIKEITGIYPMIKGVPGTVIKLSIGSQMTSNEPIYWEGPYNFIVGVDFFQDFTVSGRYLAVKFESEGQEAWELSSYDLDLEEVGDR